MRNHALLAAAIVIVGSCGSSLADDDTIPDFTYIHMLDRNTGWAETSSAVLRTTDGGKTWKKLASAQGLDIGTGVGFQRGDFAFLGSQRAWIADVKYETSTVCIERTSDGGSSWIADDFLCADTQDLFQSFVAFADERRGWLMLVPEHGMSSSPGFLYHTTNSGQTWSEIAATNDRLPRGGAIYFRDASTGWLVGADTTTTPCILSITKDDGRTWNEQKLPPPSGFPPDTNFAPIALPEFFGPHKTVGIIAASDERGEFCVIYATHDGGQSWQAGFPIKGDSPVIDFVDPLRGWIWTDDRNLYHTEDGGKHWSKTSPIEDNGLFQLDFVDSDSGWALTDTDDHHDKAILHTTDGGKTWRDLHAATRP